MFTHMFIHMSALVSIHAPTHMAVLISTHMSMHMWMWTESRTAEPIKASPFRLTVCLHPLLAKQVALGAKVHLYILPLYTLPYLCCAYT